MKLKSERNSTIIPMVIFLVMGAVAFWIGIHNLTDTALEANERTGFILATIVGGAFIIISIIYVISEIKRRYDKNSLMNGGVLCKGTIVAVEEHPTSHRNHVHPETALCQFPDNLSGGLRTVKSEYYYNRLGIYIGREVDVYIDRNNSDKYYVDMSGVVESYKDPASQYQTHDFRN